MNNKVWKQKSLTPVLLGEKDKSYSTVLDLQETIKRDEILNIAVTGPFGSGKSSVLQTFMANADSNTMVLDISLATLEADESILKTTNGDDPKNIKKEKKDRLLNRKIEYSILQQLVYRKTLEALPYSRMLKIRHFDAYAIRLISSYIVGFIILIAFAMNSSFLQIPLLYKLFWIPKNVQDAISVISVIILTIMMYEIIKCLIKKFGGIRPSKLSLAGNEVNVRYETIFIDSIRLCTQVPYAVSSVVRRMQKSLSDHELIRKLLVLLPEEYHELTELQKHPKYKETPYNAFLIKTLKEADFISSFSVENGMIKVNSKRK